MKQLLLILCIFYGINTAYAGEIVYGSGPTKASAANDADRRAEKIANKKGTCITPAKIEECKKDEDGAYICKAVAANHRGSCP